MSNTLNVELGDTVVADIFGHSGENGAAIPGKTVINLKSNDPTVATVPPSVTVPDEGAQQILGVPITVLAGGSTDITLDAKTADGTPYHDSGTLIVEAGPLSGLMSIELVLRKGEPAPTPTAAKK